ncbi:CobW family GTP-binding protein [Kineococcus gynurae]|uniref:CobW family GTP-binding protein n=1 Tax=Kineococcus gynurae TaxID=452979 RepID=A0ABV5LQ74_9ACTN
MAPVPLTVVCSLDPVLRDCVTATVLWDLDDTVVLRYDLHAGSDTEEGWVARLVADAGGVEEDVRLPLEHACLDCALREDLLPTLLTVARSGRWARVVLALPVAAEPSPLLKALTHSSCEGVALSEAVRLDAVVTVAATDRVADDLLGDDSLLEAGVQAAAGGDERACGEVLAHQLDETDLLLVVGPADARAEAVLAHVCSGTRTGLHEVTGRAVTARRRVGTHDRSDLRRAHPTGAADGEHAWTLDLHSARALHPRRLLSRLEQIGAGRLRSRGVFWLPARRDVVGAWDGAGGSLSIGSVGPWDAQGPRTRLVVTGDDPADADRVRRAFEEILATTEEAAALAGAAQDGLEPWLGPVAGDPHDLEGYGRVA